MKTALYPRLAWDGLRKNKRLFTPYLLTCVCMVMMFYILSFLGSPETCALLPRGSNSTGLILNLGSFVIFVFSAIFLYYTIPIRSLSAAASGNSDSITSSA